MRAQPPISPAVRAEVAAAYAQWHGPLVSFLIAQGATHWQARDLAQTTWVKAMAAWGQFDPGRVAAPWRPNARRNWVYQIARRLLIDEARRGGQSLARQPHSLEVLAEQWGAGAGAAALAEPAAPDDVPAQAEAAEDARRLRVALAGLSARERSALLDRHLGEVPVAVMAAQRGLTLTGAKSVVFRARARLRARWVAAEQQREPAGVAQA